MGHTIALIAVAGSKVPEHIEALNKSLAQKRFDVVQLLTPESVDPLGIEVINIPKMDYKGYNEFIAMELWKYVETDYIIHVQNDGYIINGSRWTDEFLDYDYIGAPWVPNTHYTRKGVEVRVGNGGFALRSKKLLEAPTKLGLTFTDMGTGFWHEDGFLCNHYRHELEDYGVKFAPVEVASRFSTEFPVPETVESFGAHGVYFKS